MTRRPVVRALIRVRDREHLGFLERLTDDLQTDRLPAFRETAWNAHAG
jgi:hypothetical protein